MAKQAIRIIVSPYHVGIKDFQVGAGPGRILQQGLVNSLKAQGETVSQIKYIESVDDHVGEIGRSFEVLRRVSQAVREAKEAGDFPVVLAGNCNNTVGVSAGLGAHDADFVWFDAHPDFDDPNETLNEYFDVNGVSMLAGAGWNRLANTIPGHKPMTELSNFRYVGLRDFRDDVMRNKARTWGPQVVYGGEDTPKEGFAAALEKTFTENMAPGCTGEAPCVVHLDVDSLDTSVGIANFAASPGGLTKEDALGCMRAIKAHRKPLAITVASFDPKYDPAGGIADAAVAAILELVKDI